MSTVDFHQNYSDLKQTFIIYLFFDVLLHPNVVEFAAATGDCSQFAVKFSGDPSSINIQLIDDWLFDSQT